MGDIQKALDWFYKHHHSRCNARYSMISRYGNPDYDCSSAVFYALIEGGFLPKNQAIGNTETLFSLAKQGYFKEIYNYSDVRAGDIFITGLEGHTLGAGGHTGMFYKKDGIVHCNYSNNGISYNDSNEYISYFLDRYRHSEERYFRPIKDFSEKPKNTKKAVLNRVIDISEWQDPKNIDYDKLAKNIDGAILRTSYTYSKDKSFKYDKHFETHYKELSKRGVPLGAYHFSRAVNKKEAKDEANFMYEIIKSKKFELPIFVDMESEEQNKTSKKDISTTIYYWCKELEEKGYFVGFYCNLWFLKEKVQDYIKKGFTFWLANYTTDSSPNFDGDFGMWQHTSQGRVDGYSGDLDLNRVYVDYINIISSRNLNKVVEEKKAEDVKKVEVVDKFEVTEDELLEQLAKKHNTTVENVKKQGYSINIKGDK